MKLFFTMRPCIERSAFGFLLVLIVFTAVAQEISPYSRYGYGDSYSPAFTAVRAIGGISAAYQDDSHINPANPASYTSLKLTTFETGLRATTKGLLINDTTYRTGDLNIDFAALAFPFNKYGAVSFGLLPYSSVSYQFEDQLESPDYGSYIKSFTGDGRMYRVYLGGAVRVPNTDTLKHQLSIGVNASYLFGKRSYRETVQFTDDANVLGTQRRLVERSGDFVWDAGIQYENHIKSDLSLVAGLYGHLPFDVRTNSEEIWERFLVSGSTSEVVDTVELVNQEIQLAFPPKIGAGLMLAGKDKWKAGIDLSYQLWEQVVSREAGASYENALCISLGGEFRPSNKSNAGLLKRMIYRAGGYYDSGYLNLSGQRLSEYGITFGWSLPVKSITQLNFSFTAGSRGKEDVQLFKENFFKAYLGITMNDKWFIKRKYD